MNYQYINEVIARADSGASIFIGAIVLICLVGGLFKGDNNGGKK